MAELHSLHTLRCDKKFPVYNSHWLTVLQHSYNILKRNGTFHDTAYRGPDEATLWLPCGSMRNVVTIDDV